MIRYMSDFMFNEIVSDFDFDSNSYYVVFFYDGVFAVISTSSEIERLVEKYDSSNYTGEVTFELNSEDSVFPNSCFYYKMPGTWEGNHFGFSKHYVITD